MPALVHRSVRTQSGTGGAARRRSAAPLTLDCAGSASFENSCPPVQRARSRERAVARRIARAARGGRSRILQVDRRHDGDHVDRHVDRAGDARHFGRRQPARGVDAVGQHDERAGACCRARAHRLRRGGNRVVQRRHAPGRDRSRAVPCSASRSVVNGCTTCERGVEREDRRFVARRPGDCRAGRTRASRARSSSGRRPCCRSRRTAARRRRRSASRSKSMIGAARRGRATAKSLLAGSVTTRPFPSRTTPRHGHQVDAGLERGLWAPGPVATAEPARKPTNAAAHHAVTDGPHSAQPGHAACIDALPDQQFVQNCYMLSHCRFTDDVQAYKVDYSVV